MKETKATSSRLEAYLANPRKGLWAMTLPMMVGMSLQTIYMIVDMVFVGRISSQALTALAFNMPVVFLGLGVTFGLGSGITAVVARFIGAGDKTRADRAAEHAILLGAAITVLFTFAGLRWGRSLLEMLGVPAELLPLAWDYFHIIVFGYGFLVMTVFFRCILSGEGNMRTPVAIQGSATILNIILDPILIFTFDMGVQGAALATVVSQAAAAAVFIYLLFFRDHAYVTFDLRHFRWRPAILADIVRIGAPASFSFLIMSFGGAVFNRLLVDYSSDAVAAYQVGSRLDHVVLLPMISLAAAIVTVVGMFVGAGRMDLVREIVRYAMTWAVGIAGVLGVLFFVFAHPMVSIFSQDEGIRSMGVTYLRIVAFAYPFIAVSMLTGRVLQGLGFGTPVLLITTMRVVFISAPLAYVFTYWLGRPVEWVWIAMLIGVVSTALGALGWLRWRLRWMERKASELARTGEPRPAVAIKEMA